MRRHFKAFGMVAGAALALALGLAGCAEQAGTVGNAPASPVAGKKVAYILNMSSSEIFQLCANQCEETAEKLGMECDVFFPTGTTLHSRTISVPVRRADMTGCICHMADRTIRTRFSGHCLRNIRS